MGREKGRRRSEESEGNVAMKERERGELVVRDGGNVDLNVREEKKQERKRKADSIDALNDVNEKGHADDRVAWKVEEEKNKEKKEKNKRKKRKINVDEQQGEVGDANLGSDENYRDDGKVEEERKRKKQKNEKEKKNRKVEEPGDNGHADFDRVELDDGNVKGEDRKKEKKSKVEKHQNEKCDSDFVTDGIERDDEKVEAKEEEEEGKENISNKKNKMKKRKNSEEKEIDRSGKKGEGRDAEVAITEHNGEKRKGKRVKNGWSNMQSEEQGNEQSICRDDVLLERELGACNKGEEKGNILKKGEKKHKKAKSTEKKLEGNGQQKNYDDDLNKERPERTTSKVASKKVTFADNVEVFPFRDNRQDIVVGKRYSKEEDELIKQAIYNYIESYGLGENGLEMVLACQKYKRKNKRGGLWKEISQSLPWRHPDSVHKRAEMLFRKCKEFKWTPEYRELVLLHHKKYGPTWSNLARSLGMYRNHVKDMFRLIKSGDQRRGRWTVEELEKLYDLVNKDLQMRVVTGKKTNWGMIRENISWTAISEQLGTRKHCACCHKWYQMSSPMVQHKTWEDTDDYRLVNALAQLDACSFVEVDWDNLLEHRSGELCVKRWKELIRTVDRYYSKSFMELVEILSKRYSWDVLEAREAYDKDKEAL